MRKRIGRKQQAAKIFVDVWPEAVFVNVMKPRNRFLGSINVYKYGL